MVKNKQWHGSYVHDRYELSKDPISGLLDYHFLYPFATSVSPSYPSFTMKQSTSVDPAHAESPASPAIADDAKSFDDRPQSAACEDVGSAATLVSAVVVRDISFDLEDSSESDKSESRAPGISELGEGMDEGNPSSDVINTRWCEVREGLE